MAVISRLDNFAVNTLSRYCQQPQEEHLIAAKRVLRYLRGIDNVGILFPHRNKLTLVSYVDADYGRDLDTRRPVSGLIQKLDDAPIDWSINKLGDNP